jgi:hypothetical protein
MKWIILFKVTDEMEVIEKIWLNMPEAFHETYDVIGENIFYAQMSYRNQG